MSEQSIPEIPYPIQITRMVMSLWVPQAIHAAAVLGVADSLAAGGRRHGELADQLGVDADALHRLLRALKVLGICAETAEGVFSLTPLGGCLCADAPDSVRSWALLMGSPSVWRAWAALPDCIRSGKAAPMLLDGMDAFERLAADPVASAVFDDAMAELTRQIGPAVAAAYDFSGVRELIDIGGGHGGLLPAILKANPHLRARVFDLPHCEAGARQLFAAEGVGDRAGFEGGSFFERVPPGADAYSMKSVLHDWNDERSLVILGNCRAAMTAGARLLIVEVVVPEQAGASPLDAMIAATDLNMLVNTGGKERSEAQYRQLLGEAGFDLVRVVPSAAALSIIEARRRD